MTAMSGPLLEIKDVSRSFTQSRGFMSRPAVVRAVDSVSLSLNLGKTLGLVGESGCGKSTLARMAVRLLAPDSGDVLLDGSSIFTKDAAARSTLPGKIQMVFQDPYSSLNPRHKIGSSIGESLACAGMPKKERLARVEELLGQVGLAPEHAQRYPHEFSGGQRQRMALARALAPSPKVVVCDEPVSSLDASVQAQVLNLLKDSQERLGLSYLFISHDLAVVSHMSDDVAVMYLGRVVEQGTARDIFGSPMHPYTITLLEASGNRACGLGTAGGDGNTATAADNPQAVAGGCAFFGRCPRGKKECLDAVPALVEKEPGHFVRCMFPVE